MASSVSNGGSGELRHRQTNGGGGPKSKKSNTQINAAAYNKKGGEKIPESTLARNDKSIILGLDQYKIANALLTVVAFMTRFYLLNHPNEVVFDEVHFGKFASYYLERTYFFDLHPPFAKLLIAFVGYIVGYDGAFKFDNIGDSYLVHKVPYVAYRSLSASLGALTVPIVFRTLQESGYSVLSCVLGGALILFDNAHVSETRLILLDSTLIISMAMSLYSYVKFSKMRRVPFSSKWWLWLILTGVSLSCVISTKYVGAFTFMTIGSAVIIDLWNMLDVVQYGLTIKQLSKHFAARFFGLIIVPLGIFLFWFWVHFAVLTRSGPGDGFMSPEFQETLGDNLLAKEAKQVNFYDTITLKHKTTGAILHSHEARYPLRYDDGRISSQGQQVTGYGHADPNNEWQILPVIDYPESERDGHPVHGNDKIRLRHTATDSYLMTHDVASPYYPTNQEFTTVTIDEGADSDRFNDTLFQLKLSSNGNDILKTKAGLFKVVHEPTRVAMWSHTTPLPEWGFGQFEINGNKNSLDATNIWYFDEITDLTDPERLQHVPKEPKKMSFWKKYIELQLTMFAQNNALTSSHPYASEPITWPFLVRGASFWTNDASRAQIYFHGNFIGWWLEISLIAVYLGIIVADQITRKRNVYPIGEAARSKLYNSLGFFFVAWACHYFPFFLMGRQKFLHHYLPANLASCYLAAGLFDFIFGEFDDDVLQKRVKGKQTINKKLVIAIALTLSVLIACFIYYAPLTYGSPGLSVEQVKARQLMNIELHYSK